MDFRRLSDFYQYFNWSPEFHWFPPIGKLYSFFLFKSIPESRRTAKLTKGLRIDYDFFLKSQVHTLFCFARVLLLNTCIKFFKKKSNCNEYLNLLLEKYSTCNHIHFSLGWKVFVENILLKSRIFRQKKFNLCVIIFTFRKFIPRYIYFHLLQKSFDRHN